MFDTTHAPRRAHSRIAPLSLALLLAAACGGNDKTSIDSGSSGGAVGAFVANPDPASPSKAFMVDTNRRGAASAVRLTRILWGRLVDIRDETGALQNVDYVIDERVLTNNVDFVLDTNAVTAETTLTILHTAGTPEYEAALRQADNLIPIQPKSLSPTELPPFSVAPRNAAVVLQFDDLLDPDTIDADTVRLLTGTPPQTPFTNVRVFADINHGDLAPNGQFRPTRLIIDPTVSDIEAQEAAAQGSLLQTNALGLPASVTTGQANAVVRIASRRFLPSDKLLVNLAGKPAAFDSSNDPRDTSSATGDVLRAFRSGGPTSVTGDLNNGYLLDLVPPRILGAQGIQVTSVCSSGGAGCPGLGPNEFLTSLRFDVTSCAVGPRTGDVVQQGQTFAEVVHNAPTPVNGQVSNVRLRVISPLNGTLTLGAGQFRSPFNPVTSIGREACFVRFQPTPVSPPGPNGEVLGVLTGATAAVTFSEPMDPLSLTPYDSYTITRRDPVATAEDFVVGQVIRTGDLRQFTFVPALPFAKAALGQVGDNENYFVNLASGTDGPIDLAGNALVEGLPQVEFRMLPSQPAQNTAGFVLRFESTDELGSNNAPELRGQLLYDFASGVIRPRSVTRFTALADRTQTMIGRMNITPLGIQTPLSGLGSRMHTVWRHVDLGLGLLDDTTHNLDVEGLYWSPKSGTVIQEIYDLFEISLAHSRYLPDEHVDATLFPSYPASGLVPSYAGNQLSAQSDPLEVVHPRDRGYLVDPGTLPTSTGTPMVPFPLNRGLPAAQRSYYTWRDTAILELGGPAGSGADPDSFYVANGFNPIPPKPFLIHEVPTVGLPLLMEFKCFPTKALGLNGFDTSFTVASSPRPNFRAFSTGGIDSSGTTVIKNPDLETVATGGFNPSANGATTLTADNTVYIGQVDLITRVSRVHTIWFDTASPSPTFVQPAIEPRPESQPQGTQVTMAFRGATVVSATELKTNAGYIDMYGDPQPITGHGSPNPTPTSPAYLNGDATWKADIISINGAQFVQVRISFVSSAETLLTPVLSSLGIAFTR